MRRARTRTQCRFILSRADALGAVLGLLSLMALAGAAFAM